MKTIRGSFRLLSLMLVGVLLIVAMTVPSAAADVQCPKLWGKIDIERVDAVYSEAVWNASGLLSYDYDGVVNVGELMVTFSPLNRSDFDGYRITATPSSNDPGVSDEFGIDAVSKHVSHDEAGSPVTMNLEPGTRYYIEVVAVNSGLDDTYILSQAQGAQDDRSHVTPLSPPFLGAYTVDDNTMDLPMDSGNPPLPNGTHFLLYKQDQELHAFRWLNPVVFGPYDHVWKSGDEYKKGADILCMDKDGVVEACPPSDTTKPWEWGMTHYQVQIQEIGGNLEYVEYVAVGEDLRENLYYEAMFNLADGDYIFSVQAGRFIGSDAWEPMSGTASVQFGITGDYKRYNQTIEEWRAIVDHLAGNIEEEDDRDHWFSDSEWLIYDDSIDSDGMATSTTPTVGNQSDVVKIIAHLNNIYR